MDVELLSFTPDALTLLLRTKNTRLAHGDDPAQWSAEQRAEQLAYMRDTIQSSWEFVDYVFSISGVTRAFTHQLVRTRTGSYAQESHRAVDVRDHEVVEPAAVALLEAEHSLWTQAVQSSLEAYAGLIDRGVAVQDARGLLPTSVTTSIIAKLSLRALHDMGKVRLCTRTQGEYQTVFRAMRSLVVAVHPWAADFIDVYCAQHGTCAFPRYGRSSCHLFALTVHDEAVRAATAVREAFWGRAPQESDPAQRMPAGWIGVDLDGTLAHYDGWRAGEIGAPVQPMVERVLQWLGEGKVVKVVTARDLREAGKIRDWLVANGLPPLEVTNRKDQSMQELWDDRAVRVERNTGKVV